MKGYLLLAVVGIVIPQASHAQFNIQTDDGNVTMGADGIHIRKSGKSVDLGSGGISAYKTKKTVKVNSTGISARNGRNSAVINSSGMAVKKGTVSTRTKTSTKTVVSLDQRVSSLEIQAYGKKTVGVPLIGRVEKLEADTLGATGTGTLNVRISKLAAALGTTEATSRQTMSVNEGVTTTRSTIENSGGVPTVDISKFGNSEKIQAVGAAAGVGITGGTGKDIILDTSSYEGTIAGNGGNVVLNASGCDIKITGTVNALVLNGSSNDITCDTVRHVQSNGSANTVSWSRGVSPSIADHGSANTLRSR